MDNILIVEDEEDLLDTLVYNLRREGYQTHAFLSGEEGLHWIMHHASPDLALLDVVLPGVSGIEVCRCLRLSAQTYAVPVVFLSARKEEIDRTIGFELGADDYIIKPFNIRELLLRIRAVLRRREQATMPPPGRVRPEGIENLELDEENHRLWVDRQAVALTAMESRLLALLLSRRGVVQSREMLLAEVWNASPHPRNRIRAVDVYVRRLREKLGPAGKMLETIQGVGYRFRELL